MRYVCLCLLMFSFSSCFEVLEQITLKNDGSGTLNIKLNLSQSKTKMKSIMLMEKVNGHRVPKKEEIKKEFKDLVSTANAINGISNAAHTYDFTDYIFSFSCDFTDLDKLNSLIYAVRKKKSKKPVTRDKYVDYEIDAKKMKRNFTFAWTKDYLKLSAEDKKVFDEATFTGVYKFARKVNSNSNSNAKISANKQAVMLRLNVIDVINKKKTIKNTIQLN